MCHHRPGLTSVLRSRGDFRVLDLIGQFDISARDFSHFCFDSITPHVHALD